jgi:YgiT-type zinc finger domain-containing protein
MKKCPICNKGNLKEGKIEEEMFGVVLGRFKAEICSKCGESFISSETMKEIEEKAKKKGLWGLAEKVKVVKSGNSLVIRIPAKVAKFFKLRIGEELLIYPEKKKLTVEPM